MIPQGAVKVSVQLFALAGHATNTRKNSPWLAMVLPKQQSVSHAYLVVLGQPV